jgi:lysophospholipase L1-like esterase
VGGADVMMSNCNPEQPGAFASLVINGSQPGVGPLQLNVSPPIGSSPSPGASYSYPRPTQDGASVMFTAGQTPGISTDTWAAGSKIDPGSGTVTLPTLTEPGSISMTLTDNGSTPGPVKITGTFRCGSSYVALGDSFAAGITAPHVAGGSSCYRSSSAYPVLYDPNVSFWACSGATIAAIEQSQLSHLDQGTQLVTITAGGNDSGVWLTLAQCLLRIDFGNVSLGAGPCPPPADITGLANLRVRLTALYDEIHARAPEARIFVVGYPNPLPATTPTTDCPDLELKLLTFTGPRLRLASQDLPALHNLIDRINTTIKFAVADSRVATYISPDQAFAGHDACSKASYFWPLQRHIEQETLHPTTVGQAVLAKLLHDAAGDPPA